MNERIKELAHKADFIGKKHNGDFWRWGYIDPELNSKLDKFAQLIVRECAAQAEDESSWPYTSFGKKIKEHFGVEDYHTTNIIAGAKIHSGDDGVGYSIGTQEKYEEFVKKRNGN